MPLFHTDSLVDENRHDWSFQIPPQVFADVKRGAVVMSEALLDDRTL